MAITNPNYYGVGAVHPPISEAARLQRYADYRSLYEGSQRSYALMYPETFARIERELGFTAVDRIAKELPRIRSNLFRKLSKFWSYLLFSFPPVIDAGSTPGNILLKPWLDDIYSAGTQVTIDASRFGDGLYWLTMLSDGTPALRNLCPEHWFPVVADDDQDVVLGDYIAVPYSEGNNFVNDRLRVTRMIVGEPITITVYKLAGQSISSPLRILEGEVLRERAIFSVHNGAMDGMRGESDYPDLIPVVAEMDRRFSGNSRIMDRHTNPHLTGPRSAVRTDAAGNVVIDVQGQYFPVEEGETTPEYLVWDGKLESSFTQIDQMQRMFHILSDTSMAAFGLQGDGNSIESGAALRKLLYSSYLRLGLLRRAHERAIRQTVTLINPAIDLMITWSNPYLDNVLEDAQAEEIRLNSGTTTPEDAIARLDHVDTATAGRVANAASERLERTRAREARTGAPGAPQSN